MKLCSALLTDRNHIFNQKQKVPARKHLVGQYVDVGLAVEGEGEHGALVQHAAKPLVDAVTDGSAKLPENDQAVDPVIGLGIG